MTKTVLITGANTGFGRGTAEILAKAGHRVFAAMPDPAGKNREHANLFWAQGIEVVALDVTSDISVEKAVREVTGKAGRIDVLVNNAVIASVGATEAFLSVQARMIFETNVLGLLRTARCVLAGMRLRGDGLIINIGSVLGRVTFPFLGLYGASKFAVEALTDSLRYEVSQFGVEVALVQPSIFPMPMLDEAQTAADTERAKSYGSVGDSPISVFRDLFCRCNSSCSHDEVSVAIGKLVDMPKGTRPARTVVGNPLGVDEINREARAIQRQVLENFDFDRFTGVT